VLVALGIWACHSEVEKPTDIGLNYFPLKKGFYQIYDIDSIGYSEVSEPETLRYELMTEVTDSFPNTESDYTYIIHRSKRENANSAWQFIDVWSVRINNHELIEKEGNTEFVKIIFPVKKSTVWDGNKFNIHGNDDYEILSVDDSYSVNGIDFAKSLTINQNDNEDLIVFQDKRTEIYARETGLILKEIIQLNYCTDQDCLGQQIITSGTIYKQAIKEYGIR
jgi:hypothetical protein